MLIRNVLPGTLDILARQGCIILLNGKSELSSTIPIERILSFNKNTMIIDDANRYLIRQSSLYRTDKSTDFVGACILRIEPMGNIFAAEIEITQNLVDEVYKLYYSDTNLQKNDEPSPFYQNVSTELKDALMMAIMEIHNRMMAATAPSRMSSISMFPQQFQSQMSTIPQFSHFLQTDPNRPIAHRMPFSTPVPNTTARFTIQPKQDPPKESFSRPAAFGPSQAKNLKIGTAEFGILPKQQGTPVVYPIPDNLPPFNPSPPTILPDEQQAQCFGQIQPMVARYNQQTGVWQGVSNVKPMVPQKNEEVTTIEANAKVLPVDHRREARKETANHISGMINAILASGNTHGVVPMSNGPIAAFVNGDGDVILSYSDGSISPAINPETVGVDETLIGEEMQDPSTNDFPIPVKALNPFSTL